MRASTESILLVRFVLLNTALEHFFPIFSCFPLKRASGNAAHGFVRFAAFFPSFFCVNDNVEPNKRWKHGLYSFSTFLILNMAQASAVSRRRTNSATLYKDTSGHTVA